MVDLVLWYSLLEKMVDLQRDKGRQLYGRDTVYSKKWSICNNISELQEVADDTVYSKKWSICN